MNGYVLLPNIGVCLISKLPKHVTLCDPVFIFLLSAITYQWSGIYFSSFGHCISKSIVNFTINCHWLENNFIIWCAVGVLKSQTPTVRLLQSCPCVLLQLFSLEESPSLAHRVLFHATYVVKHHVYCVACVVVFFRVHRKCNEDGLTIQSLFSFVFCKEKRE